MLPIMTVPTIRRIPAKIPTTDLICQVLGVTSLAFRTPSGFEVSLADALQLQSEQIIRKTIDILFYFRILSFKDSSLNR